MEEIQVTSENGELRLRKSEKLVGLKTTGKREPQRVETEVIPDLGGFEVVTLETNERNIDEALDEVRKEDRVDVGTHVYFAEGDNRPVVPTGLIYCSLAEGVAAEESRPVFKSFHLDILEEREDGTVVLSVTKKSRNPLKVSADLQQLAMIEKAVPDLDVPLDQYFTDPRDGLLNEEWHLDNNGAIPGVPNFPLKVGADAKVRDAWRRLNSLGSSSIVVAVIDNGFDLSHPDLSGKAVAPLNISSGSAWIPTGARHGDHATPCASVAVASANGRGMVGVAPMSRLMPLHGLTFSKFLTERMFNHCVRNGADIVSCSWGTIDSRYRPGSIHVQAIRRALTAGRSGKGCVVVFAAGNEGREYINYYAAIPGVIAVGASTSNDTHARYSNRGSGLSVVAPSDGGWPILAARASWDPGTPSMPTPKRYYVDGRDRGQFHKHFGGTSSATPLVAGICALILSANPELTSAEVKSILERTADKIGARWEYDASGYSQKYGYGRVNADRAVAEALRMRDAEGTTRPTRPIPVPGPTPVPTPTPPPPSPVPPAPAPPPPVSTGSGQSLYRFSASRQPTRGFGLQVNAYRNFGNVLEATEKLERLFQAPVVVAISEVNGVTAYKVILGAFATADEARALTPRVKAAGYNPFVKNLATFG